MVTIPADAWRGGAVRQVITIGGAVGLCLGALAWIDSGFLVSGIAVFAIVGTGYGVFMQRRMARFWPGARDLDSASRAMVVRTARRGERLADARLVQPVIDYRNGLHAAADDGRPIRWVIALVLVVGLAAAAWDAAFGSWGNLIASAIYLAALLVEVAWWPRRQAEILDNADRAVKMAESAFGAD